MSARFIILFILIGSLLRAQVVTTTLRPGPATGKDALLDNRAAVQNTNFGNSNEFASWAWTINGERTDARSLIQFDLSFIPATATVQSARLSLYCDVSSAVTQLQAGNNESSLERVTTSWNENTVTWNNQPTTTSINRIALARSTSKTQDYTDIDVTKLIIDSRNVPASSFGLMIRLETEAIYCTMLFASSDHPDSTKWPKLVVTYVIDTCASFHNVTSFTADPALGAAPLLVHFSAMKHPAIQTLMWNFGDSSAPGSGTSPFHTYYKPGLRNVRLTAVDSRGCRDSSELDIEVTDSCADIIGAASFYAIPAKGTAPLAVQFTATSPPAAISFLWDFGDSTVGAIIKNTSHTYYRQGKLNAKLVVRNNRGCADSSLLELEILDSCADIKKAASFTANPLTGPEPLQVQFVSTSKPAASSFVWDFGDTTAISAAKDPTHVFIKRGIYVATLVAFNPRNCPDTAKATIVVLDSCAMFKNAISFSFDPVSGYVPLTVQFTNKSRSDATSFLWSFGDLDTSVVRDPEHIYQQDKLYRVQLKGHDARGCADSAEANLRVVKDIHLVIPNVFTPNHDGVNDEFEIDFTPFSLLSIKGTIWNRWGGEVYTFDYPNAGWWNGTSGKEKVSDGVYFFIFDTMDLNRKLQTFKGTVTIIR